MRFLFAMACAGLFHDAMALDLGLCEARFYGGLSGSSIEVSEWSQYAEGDRQGLGIASVDSEDSSTGVRLFAGLDCGAHLAVEAGYAQMGEVTARAQADGSGSLPAGTYDETLEMGGLDVSVVGRLPLSERWALFGRAGILRSFTKLTGDVSKDEETVNNLLYGAGLSWSPSEHWRLAAEYVGSQVATPPSGAGNTERDGDARFVSLGIAYLP